MLAQLPPLEAKKMRRAIKNRESAQRSRKRKRERLSQLEVFTVAQDAYVASLEARLAALERLMGADAPALPAVLVKPEPLDDSLKEPAGLR